MNPWVEIISAAIFLAVFVLTIVLFVMNYCDELAGIISLTFTLMGGSLFVVYAMQNGGSIAVANYIAHYGFKYVLFAVILLGSILGIVYCKKRIIGAISWILTLTPILIFIVFLSEAQIGRHIDEEMKLGWYIKETIMFYIASYVFLGGTMIFCFLRVKTEEGIKSIIAGGMICLIYVLILYAFMAFRERNIIEASSLPGLETFMKIPEWWLRLWLN